VWSRDINTAYRAGRAIQAGRVWTNSYHLYPAHAAFGGYKGSGIGLETHKMMLEHYQQTKNLLVSYSPTAMGFFWAPAMTASEVSRVALTPAAAELLRALYAAHGPLMFHQSGGCCDGSAPMCYTEGEFRTGASDVLWPRCESRGCRSRSRSGCRPRSSAAGGTRTLRSTWFLGAAAAFRWRHPKACGSSSGRGCSPSRRTPH